MNYEQHLKQLVRIPSLSNEEDELADYLLSFYEDRSLPVEKWGDNVVVHFDGGHDDALILNVHMDTVSPGNENRWDVPPTGPDAGMVRDKKLYGLGASDAKASIASFSLLASELGDRELNLDLFIVLVTREELDGRGTRQFLKEFEQEHQDRYNRLAAVVGEPTNLDTIEIGHRGTAYLKIRTEGRTGHATRPESVEPNAIDDALEMIRRMRKLEEEVIPEFRHDNLGDPSFSLTGIRSAPSSPNQFPGSCETTWDLRTTPGLHEQLESLLEKRLSGCSFEFTERLSPPGYTSPEEEIVSVFEEVVDNLDVKVARGASDVCFFTESGIPAVTFGPGLKEVIHSENEYVPVSNVRRAADVYADVIERFANR